MLMLCGAERTGKSTLAQAYAQERGITYVPSQASAIFRSMDLPVGPLPPQTRVEVQHRILDGYLAQLAMVEGQAVCDRSPLDMAAYLMLDLQGTDFDYKAVEHYLDRCYGALNRYGTALVLVQPGIPYVAEDGKPSPCLTRQWVMTSIIAMLMRSPMVEPPIFQLGRYNLDLSERLASLNLIAAKVIEAIIEQRGSAPLH